MWLSVPICTVLKQSGQDRFPLAGRTGDPLLVQKRDVVARLRVGWTVPEKSFAVNHVADTLKIEFPAFAGDASVDFEEVVSSNLYQIRQCRIKYMSQSQ